MITSPANHRILSQKNNYPYLLLTVTLLTLGLTIMGNLVRLTDSSQGCPDWPTCYGQWGIPAAATAQIQYAHRLTTLLDVGLILFVTTYAIIKYRQFKLVLFPLLAILMLFPIEVLLGRSATYAASSPLNGVLHLTFALVIFSLLILATTTAFYLERETRATSSLDYHGMAKKLSLVFLVGLLLVMVSGEFVVVSGSVPTCSVWPFCGGQALTAGILRWLPFTHSLLAGLFTFLAIGMFITAWKSFSDNPVVLTSATASAVLYFGQVLIGELKVIRGFPSDLVGVHAITTAGLWAAVCVLTVSIGLSKQITQEGVGDNRRAVSFKQRVKDFFMLTKPLIVILLLVTTVTGMVMGGRGLPTLPVLLWTLLGGGLAAGGASAVNQ